MCLLFVAVYVHLALCTAVHGAHTLREDVTEVFSALE